jgi:hypothetical protein
LDPSIFSSSKAISDILSCVLREEKPIHSTVPSIGKCLEMNNNSMVKRKTFDEMNKNRIIYCIRPHSFRLEEQQLRDPEMSASYFVWKKRISRMNSAITSVRSELASLSIVGHLRDLFSSAGDAFAVSLRQKSKVFHRHTHLWVLSQFPSIWGFWLLKPLTVKKRTIARWFIWHFCMDVCQNKAPHNGASYTSISVNLILLDSLFRKEYRYSLIISPFSTGEKQ